MAKIPFVDLNAQYLSIKDDIDAVLQRVILDSAFIGGKFVKSFEDSFAEYVGVKHCIGVGNGTDAIAVALRALGVGPGDEVITVANSFIATSEAITMAGARVVFVDCDPATYNIDISKIEAAINPKTKAIIPVHLYGRPADMFQIMKLAGHHGLYVVEDAAQAHGAVIDGQRIGTFGHLACFSFYPGKNLGAYGDGGAIVTTDDDLAQRCRMIANHGRFEKYDHALEGINSRLDGMQAAVLTVKLKHLEEWTEKRRKAAALYSELLQSCHVVLPTETSDMRSVYHLYVIKVENRQHIQDGLAAAGISTGIHYPIALPNLEAYRYLGHTPGDFPVATQNSGEILSLPMFPELTPEQIECVCTSLKKLLT